MRIASLFFAIAAAIGLAAPAAAHDRHQGARYGDHVYHGNDGYLENHGGRRHWRGTAPRDREIVVQGIRLPRHLEVSRRVRLDPWLADTWQGRKFVRDHYRVTRWNTIDEDDAENANVFFRRWADHDRDFRLTDTEIRTALNHVASGYGLPDSPSYGHHRGRYERHHRERRHREHGHHRHEHRERSCPICEQQEEPKPPEPPVFIEERG